MYRTVMVVRQYAYARWRYDIRHPRAGEISRVECYCTNPHDGAAELLQHRDGRFRRGDGVWLS